MAEHVQEAAAGTGTTAQLVECLPNMHEAQGSSSIPRTDTGHGDTCL